MKLNYSNILTIEDLQNLSEEEYSQIKLIGEAFKKKKKKLNYRLYQKSTFEKRHASPNDINTEAFEFAFRNRDFENESYLKKVLINAEVLLPNNEIMITLLLSKNITRKNLLYILCKVIALKKLSQIKDEEKLLDDSTTLSDKNINVICTLVNKYCPCENYNLIIAKLTEIVLFEKELYQKLEGGKQKTR